MVTGVPPQYNVDEFIASKNNVLKALVKAIKKRRQKNTKRPKVYRSSDELPNDVKELIRELTHYDSRKRATVRSAASHPWILSDIAYSEHAQCPPSKHLSPILYLKCAVDVKIAAEEDSV
jgi:serine/threonine protein kinase